MNKEYFIKRARDIHGDKYDYSKVELVDMILHKGDRVWFNGDKKPFRVRAANERFAICTKPYNFQPKTVIYTIVDFEWGMRGMDNMIFGIYSYYSDEECEEALQALTNGELEVSSKTHKHTRLEIERIVKRSSYENGRRTSARLRK